MMCPLNLSKRSDFPSAVTDTSSTRADSRTLVRTPIVPSAYVASVRSSTSTPSRNVRMRVPRSEIFSVCGRSGSMPWGKDGVSSTAGRITVRPLTNTCGRSLGEPRTKFTCHM